MNNLSEEIKKLAWELCEVDHDRDKASFKAGAKAMLELLEPTLKEIRHELKLYNRCDDWADEIKKLDKILSSSES